jgi:hypothetical protein
VEINLWSICFQDTRSRPTIGTTAETTGGELAVFRFDRLLSIAESATPAAVESPVPDGDAWYRPWAALLSRLRNDASEALATSDSRQSASQVSRPVEEQLTASSARLETWIEQCSKALTAPKGESMLPELWSSELVTSNVSSGQWVYCATDGGLDRLTLKMATDNVDSPYGRAIAVLVVVSLSAAALLLLHRPGASDLLYQWPHAVGVLIGIAGWAWLQPSWLGLLIAMGCIALAVRSGWPGRPIRLDASTVLRASRPK